MSLEVAWTDTALERASEAVDFIAERNPSAAAGWLGDLFASLESHAENPFMAPQWPRGGTPAIRQIAFRSHVVIYQVELDRNRLSVLTIRHTKQRPLGPRDLPELPP